MDRFADFITEHQDDDTDRLLFSRKKWPDIDMHKAVSTILTRRKLKTKLPSWYANAGLIYPDTLPSEQCSSEETAIYKAALADRLIAEKNGAAVTDNHQNRAQNRWKIADLTGGLGADSWAFARIAEEVLYNETDKDRVEAARHNFKALNINNIIVFNKNISVTPKRHTDSAGIADSSPDQATPEELLKDFHPDMIYLDPARRAGDGKKVFMIEDCSPDVLTLKESLLGLSPLVMIKLSPMADIAMVTEKLGSHCREIHIVSAGGECKELLAVLDRDIEGEYTIHAVETGRASLSFTKAEEASAAINILDSIPGIPDPVNLPCLFEPGKSLLKAGAFNLLCSRFGLKKFGVSTHMYMIPDETVAQAVKGLGKIFAIREILPFNNRTVKAIGARVPGADVTARNLPISSDGLKAKLYGKNRKSDRKPGRETTATDTEKAVTSLSQPHIFAVKSDRLGNLLLITERSE